MKILYVLSKEEIKLAIKKFLTLDHNVNILVGSNLDISAECEDCETRYPVENLTVEIYDGKEGKNKENEQKKEKNHILKLELEPEESEPF